MAGLNALSRAVNDIRIYEWQAHKNNGGSTGTVTWQKPGHCANELAGENGWKCRWRARPAQHPPPPPPRGEQKRASSAWPNDGAHGTGQFLATLTPPVWHKVRIVLVISVLDVMALPSRGTTLFGGMSL